jgi:hypothetical protein
MVPLVMLVLYMYKGWLAASLGFLGGAALFGGWVSVKAILRKKDPEDE